MARSLLRSNISKEKNVFFKHYHKKNIPKINTNKEILFSTSDIELFERMTHIIRFQKIVIFIFVLYKNKERNNLSIQPLFYIQIDVCPTTLYMYEFTSMEISS